MPAFKVSSESQIHREMRGSQGVLPKEKDTKDVAQRRFGVWCWAAMPKASWEGYFVLQGVRRGKESENTSC